MTYCRFCHETLQLVYEHIPDYYCRLDIAPSDVHICNRCGIAMTVPWLEASELGAFYPDVYVPYLAKRRLRSFIETLAYRRDIRLIRRNMKESEEQKKIFEIGAGNGSFLAEARGKGFEVSGLEPSSTGVRTAMQTREIQLVEGDVESFEIGEQYDVLVMRHVLEHLANPREILLRLGQALTSDGLLFLKVPRFDSVERKYFGKSWSGLDIPRHRWHFTQAGLRQLLESQGYKIENVYRDAVPFDTARSLKNLESKWTRSTLLRILGCGILFPILNFRTSGRQIIVASRQR